MGKNVLVVYATKHGATAEIAEKIGGVIRQRGVSVEVQPAGSVKDVSSYDAVILGSALYMGRWRKEASKFLIKNTDTLAARDVWIFSTGPTGEGDPEELMEGRPFPANLLPYTERIAPAAMTIFHGTVDPEKLGGFEKWILNKVKADTGDFRDWNAIEAWAEAAASVITTGTA